MCYEVTPESFTSLRSLWRGEGHDLDWPCIFILPVWLETWWLSFQPRAELYLSAVRHGEEVIGVAPLMIYDKTAAFIGSVDVCDYLDFIIKPGAEQDFFSVLFDDLEKRGIRNLDLAALRPESPVLTVLISLARERGSEIECSAQDISMEMALPATWDEYLNGLLKKQRHEVRRKLRRLSAAGEVSYRFFRPEGDAETLALSDDFIRLFRASRRDKADFMTERMEGFFKSLALATAREGLLRYGILELDGLKIAIIMCLDYQDNIYLYNSGVDPEYGRLSAGVMSKVLGIREAILTGRKKWDFLKGKEPYKYQLGGREIVLRHYRIATGVG